MGILQEIRSEDIAPNVRKLIVCMLVDSSFSMLGTKANAVYKGINEFINARRADRFSRDVVDLCIITYGNGIKVLQPFTSVTQAKFSGIKPDGETPMRDGLIAAVNAIEERRKKWESMGTELSKPWLFVLSDGESDQPIDDIASTIKNMCLNGKIKIKCIAIGENGAGGTKTLQKLTPDKIVKEIDELSIVDFFADISRAVAAQSVSTVDIEARGDYDIN